MYVAHRDTINPLLLHDMNVREWVVVRHIKITDRYLIMASYDTREEAEKHIDRHGKRD